MALLNGDLKQIRESMHKGWALVNQKFIDEIEQISKPQAILKGTKRP